MVTPPFTDAELKALQKFACLIMQYNYSYDKAALMAKINKQVQGNDERAKKAFYSLIKAGIIKNEVNGKVVMPNR